VNKSFETANIKVETVNDGIQYLILQVWESDFIVVNVYVLNRDGVVKDTAYKELECIVNYFHRYLMKFSFGDFSAETVQKDFSDWPYKCEFTCNL
jgi:hypothetical protein